MFKCEKCGFVDHPEMAYPNGNITRPLLCTMCQGRPWHKQFPRTRELDGAFDINHPTLKMDD